MERLDESTMAKMSLNDSRLLKQAGLIGGEWVTAEGLRQFEVENPANQALIATVADLGAEQTHQAIAAADAALKPWQALSPAQRSAYLERWHQLIAENKDDLALLMTLEQGKPLAESQGEVAYGNAYVKWFAEEAKRIYGDVLPSGSDRRSLVIKQGVGVVAAITPWNFPVAMITRKIAPALAAGCTLVLKPAAETPLCALALGELAIRAGIPSGVINIVPSTQAVEVGQAMCDSKVVKKLTFTGSTRVGKILMAQCAATVKRTSMELGGNAPVIVFDDADIDQALVGVLASKYRNSGQTCICANRILVQAGIYDEFSKRLTAAVAQFNLGNGVDDGVTHGPVISTAAAQSIDTKVKAALEQGAKALIGGQVSSLGAQFYEPTVMTGVTPDMAIAKEETFGPVAPLIAFETEEEAVAMANDTDFGLAAYVYTQNMARSWRVAESLEYGMVGMNETAISSEVIPFGGVKESGQGREGSKYGLEDYLETKYICMGGL
ncbi:MAG: NAD-dependent succinate-semialdehyde dehydrogenase [Pontibacterium sp.]